VRDTGIGIRPEVLPHVFDLFMQADATLERSQGGLGIGLALVRTLAEMHGGKAEAFSDGPGHGSRFVVTLPLLPAGTRLPAPAPVSARSASHRILVVDDNADAAESLVMVLGEYGHEARMVTEARKVMDAARELRPRIVLLDISLPDVNCYEPAARFRQSPEFSNTLLVALTGYGQEEHRRRSREAGFDHHLVKPLDLAALERILADVDPRR